MFFLYLWKDLPATFGTTASFLLIKAFAKKGKNIHLVFTKTVLPSIKDCERDSRSGYQERDSQNQITGPNQRRPRNWLIAFRFDQLKVAVTSSLAWARQDDSLADIFHWKCLHANSGENCCCFQEENEPVTRALIPELTCSHEAYSKIIYHLAALEVRSSYAFHIQMCW